MARGMARSAETHSAGRAFTCMRWPTRYRGENMPSFIPGKEQPYWEHEDWPAIRDKIADLRIMKWKHELEPITNQIRAATGLSRLEAILLLAEFEINQLRVSVQNMAIMQTAPKEKEIA